MKDHLHSYNTWRHSVERRLPVFGKKKRNTLGKLRAFFKFLLILLVFGALAGAIGFAILIAWVSKDLPDPNKIIDRQVPLSTKIYDRLGTTVLYEVHGAEKRTIVELDDIPKYAQQATLSAEDREFYQHKGFSITGIVRSLIRNTLTGSRVGGSTITQQLVKNAILTSDKQYTRKAKEIILSYQIEKRFTKDEILKMYFNEIPYGSTIYGIQAASQTFFGKDAKDITLAESAILAAIPQRPTYYSPYGNNTEGLYNRQWWILDSMAKLGYISAEEAETAKKEKVVFRKPTENIIAPHFVMYIKEYLSERYGEKTVGEGGLKVITTLDLEKQKIAEEAITKQAEKNKKWDASNAALVSLDTKTGQVLAMVGSADYFNDEIDGQVNVTLRPRQPGSSFKPIVYASAFKKGYTPDTVVYDVVTTFKNTDGKPYTPYNYNLKENGPVTLRQALAGSLNVPAVKVLYLTGIDNVLDLAEKFGYTTLEQRSRFGLSLVLGGAEVKLIEHTNAFAALAREGELHSIAPVLRVEDKDGSVLEEFKNVETKIIETQIARQITSILSDNSARAFMFGENNLLVLKDRVVAAKTGTTNDNRDAWIIGYTPSIATGVWVGNNDFSEMKAGADGSVIAAPIWNEYMSKTLAKTPAESFNEPSPVISDKPVLNGSIKDGVKIAIDRITGKLATEFTPLDFIEEKTFKEVHNILYYINKDDPQGPPPQDPIQDPEFNAWEAAVQEWAKKKNITPEEPPKEYDDVHTLENRPKISITSPWNNQTMKERLLHVEVSAEAPRGIRKVEYYLAGKFIGETTILPYYFNGIIDNNNIPNGISTLRVVALDDVGNRDQAFIDLNLEFSSIEEGIVWSKPNSGAILTKESFPLSLVLEVRRPENIDSAYFYVEKSDASKIYINTTRLPATNTIATQWTSYPGAGIYTFYVVINNKDGFAYQSDRIMVEIK